MRRRIRIKRDVQPDRNTAECQHVEQHMDELGGSVTDKKQGSRKCSFSVSSSEDRPPCMAVLQLRDSLT